MENSSNSTEEERGKVKLDSSSQFSPFMCLCLVPGGRSVYASRCLYAHLRVYTLFFNPYNITVILATLTLDFKLRPSTHTSDILTPGKAPQVTSQLLSLRLRIS